MARGVAGGGRLKKPKPPNSAIIRRFDDPFYAMSPRPLILTVLLAALPLSAAPETPDGGDLNSIRHAIDEAQSELQQKQQAQQKGNPQRAGEVVQILLQKVEIREMLVRLRDK